MSAVTTGASEPLTSARSRSTVHLYGSEHVYDRVSTVAVAMVPVPSSPSIDSQTQSPLLPPFDHDAFPPRAQAPASPNALVETTGSWLGAGEVSEVSRFPRDFAAAGGNLSLPE